MYLIVDYYENKGRNVKEIDLKELLLKIFYKSIFGRKNGEKQNKSEQGQEQDQEQGQEQEQEHNLFMNI